LYGVRTECMRETLWFFASLAGAAILTALAVILPPQSALWSGILYGAIYLLLACAILIFLDMRKPLRERRKVIPLIGMIIFGLGFLGCAVWYFWPTIETVAAAPQNDVVPSQTKETTKPTASKQVSLLWEYELMRMPSVIPGGGRINNIQTSIHDDNTPSISFGGQSGEPGSPSGWDQTGANFLAQRCSLINFGEETIFNMPLTFNAAFVTMSDGHSGSQIVARTSTTMLVTSLDSGPQ
jgi:hypothetical protein